jgi:aldehyde dehydrogenase (NAD+)
MATQFDNHIAGERVAPSAGKRFTSINPTTGKVWGEFAESSREDVDRAVKAAAAAFQGPWGKLSATRRGRLLMAWGDRIADNAEAIASIETQQNGKLIAEMRAQAKVVKDFLYYFGGLAGQDRGARDPAGSHQRPQLHAARAAGRDRRDRPWNSPTFLTMMSVCPALAAATRSCSSPRR